MSIFSRIARVVFGGAMSVSSSRLRQSPATDSDPEPSSLPSEAGQARIPPAQRQPSAPMAPRTLVAASGGAARDNMGSSVDFDARIVALRERVAEHSNPERVKVTFDHYDTPILLVQDVYEKLQRLTHGELRSQFMRFQFSHQEGLDYGGLRREWFDRVSQVFTGPDLGLFRYVTEQNYELEINPNAHMMHDNASRMYRVFGRIMALGVMHGCLISATFTQAFFRQLLGQACTLEDLEAADPGLGHRLRAMRAYDAGTIEALALTMTATVSGMFGGAPTTVPLVERGEGRAVTRENVDEYVRAYVQFRLESSSENGITAIRRGFRDVLPLEVLGSFDAAELGRVLCGCAEFDVDEWERESVFDGGLSGTHRLARWFFAIVRDASAGERRKILHFVTGSHHMPVRGISDLRDTNGNPRRFKLRGMSRNGMPIAHTCFNRLDVSRVRYQSQDELRRELFYVVHNCSGFHIQ